MGGISVNESGEVGNRPQSGGQHRGLPAFWWERLSFWVQVAWQDFSYLLMPAECVVCGTEDASLCSGCARALRRQCKIPYRAEESVDALVSVFGNVLIPVVAVGAYRDGLSTAILAFKNHGHTELAPELGRCLARGLAALPLLLPAARYNSIVLVPVPSTGSGWRRRGYDPVALLLRAVVRERRLPPGLTVAPALAQRVRLPWNRKRQKSLGRAARARNVRNTMKISWRMRHRLPSSGTLRNAYVVVLDDVLTTGSTVREAARVLEATGAKVCGVLVLAAALPPDPGARQSAGERLASKSFAAKDE